MMNKEHIILYDGICNLCNGFVGFIRKRDKYSVFEFVPLQSDEGKSFIAKYGLPADKLDTVIYLEKEHLFLRSSAGLRIMKKMGWPWKIFYALIIVPKPLRDFIYDIIAKTRYRIFGKHHSCEIPSSAE